MPAAPRPKALGTLQITEMQRRFVREYIKDRNATQAAIRAGYPVAERGDRILEQPAVRAFLRASDIATTVRFQRSRDEVLVQLARIGFSDPRRLFTPEGRLKELGDVDADTAAAIQAFDVEVKKDADGLEIARVVKIRLADRRPALADIMKAQAWNKTEIGNDSNPLTELIRTLNRGVTAALPIRQAIGGPAYNDDPQPDGDGAYGPHAQLADEPGFAHLDDQDDAP